MFFEHFELKNITTLSFHKFENSVLNVVGDSDYITR